MAGAPQLNVEKWGVRGSNPGPCINYAVSLPTELSSREPVILNSIRRVLMRKILTRKIILQHNIS